jgi:hypothetical protein
VTRVQFGPYLGLDRTRARHPARVARKGAHGPRESSQQDAWSEEGPYGAADDGPRLRERFAASRLPDGRE